MATILCVDDDAAVLRTFKATLERDDHRVIAVNNAPAALKVIERGDVDLVISDFQMPDMTGLAFVTQLREEGVHLPVIMVTGHGTIEHAVSAMKAGATDYLTKPIERDELRIAVDQALELARLRRENETLRAEVRQLRGERSIVGDSEPLKRLLELVRTVAPTRSTLLVQGESGTGKELIARALHQWSSRSDGPFISVNCAALPESLIESSLFGHEKGAFTGATRMVKGAFERADGGTLLLDEVTEMRGDLQAKLLRVIQEQEFERVGGGTTIRVDVRIVATTNRDLKQAVRDGDFREDLYYRLAVVPVTVPPLRERKEDIPALAQRFARRTAAAVGKTIEGLTPGAIDRLTAYDWPGNIRELSHAVERAVILSEGRRIGAMDFELGGRRLSGEPDRPEAEGLVVLDSFDVKEAERVLIERALEDDADFVVYKSPTCGCCNGWIDHLREAGYTVEAVDLAAYQDLRTGQDGGAGQVPATSSSCHTATIEGYVIEGHVPAEAIERLLRERPDIRGSPSPACPSARPAWRARTPSRTTSSPSPRTAAAPCSSASTRLSPAATPGRPTPSAPSTTIASHDTARSTRPGRCSGATAVARHRPQVQVAQERGGEEGHVVAKSTIPVSEPARNASSVGVAIPMATSATQYTGPSPAAPWLSGSGLRAVPVPPRPSTSTDRAIPGGTRPPP
jgi:DNA-binding NtrC family response regulator